MRQVIGLALSFIVAATVTGAGLLAAPPARQQQPAGALQGVARNAQQQNLAGVRVQVRAAASACSVSARSAPVAVIGAATAVTIIAIQATQDDERLQAVTREACDPAVRRAE
jgi:hypothetical protein